MKNLIIYFAFMQTVLLASVCLRVSGQTNSFPGSGNVGIGTTTPYSADPYTILDILGKSVSAGGYIRFRTSDGSGMARILNSNNRFVFDVQQTGMFFQWRNSSNTEIFRLNQDGSSKWTGNASSYTEVASNSSGQYLRQYANNGTAMSWLIRGYATNGIQAEFRDGGIEVNGRVRAKEVKVEMANWPDYVFKEGYGLMPLADLATHIKTHGRLPGIPSAGEVEANGIELAEMNRKLLEKVEELTLYILQQREEINQLKENRSDSK